jgi:hypothetical protein
MRSRCLSLLPRTTSTVIANIKIIAAKCENEENRGTCKFFNKGAALNMMLRTIQDEENNKYSLIECCYVDKWDGVKKNKK